MDFGFADIEDYQESSYFFWEEKEGFQQGEDLTLPLGIDSPFFSAPFGTEFSECFDDMCSHDRVLSNFEDAPDVDDEQSFQTSDSMQLSPLLPNESPIQPSRSHESVVFPSSTGDVSSTNLTQSDLTPLTPSPINPSPIASHSRYEWLPNSSSAFSTDPLYATNKKHLNLSRGSKAKVRTKSRYRIQKAMSTTYPGINKVHFLSLALHDDSILVDYQTTSKHQLSIPFTSLVSLSSECPLVSPGNTQDPKCPRGIRFVVKGSFVPASTLFDISIPETPHPVPSSPVAGSTGSSVPPGCYDLTLVINLPFYSSLRLFEELLYRLSCNYQAHRSLYPDAQPISLRQDVDPSSLSFRAPEKDKEEFTIPELLSTFPYLQAVLRSLTSADLVTSILVLHRAAQANLPCNKEELAAKCAEVKETDFLSCCSPVMRLRFPVVPIPVYSVLVS